MSRLMRVLKRLRKSGDVAVIGLVVSQSGPRSYRVDVAGTDHDVAAVGGASAATGQQVAVLTSEGKPAFLLGAVRE